MFSNLGQNIREDMIVFGRPLVDEVFSPIIDSHPGVRLLQFGVCG
jgi:hypothetical protein